MGSKFFPFRVDPFSKENQNNVERVAFLERVSIPFDMTEICELIQYVHPVKTWISLCICIVWSLYLPETVDGQRAKVFLILVFTGYEL